MHLVAFENLAAVQRIESRLLFKKPLEDSEFRFSKLRQRQYLEITIGLEKYLPVPSLVQCQVESVRQSSVRLKVSCQNAIAQAATHVNLYSTLKTFLAAQRGNPNFETRWG